MLSSVGLQVKRIFKLSDICKFKRQLELEHLVEQFIFQIVEKNIELFQQYCKTLNFRVSFIL